MRESSKMDKTKLPVDTFEAWLKMQHTHPGRAPRRTGNATDSYEAWIGKRVEGAKTSSAKKKHAGG